MLFFVQRCTKLLWVWVMVIFLGMYVCVFVHSWIYQDATCLCYVVFSRPALILFTFLIWWSNFDGSWDFPVWQFVKNYRSTMIQRKKGVRCKRIHEKAIRVTFGSMFWTEATNPLERKMTKRIFNYRSPMKVVSVFHKSYCRNRCYFFFSGSGLF